MHACDDRVIKGTDEAGRTKILGKEKEEEGKEEDLETKLVLEECGETIK